MIMRSENICPWCGEPISPDEVLYDFASGENAHVECAVRIIFGSLGHMKRRLAHIRGERDDPPGLSKRQAANAAYMFLKAAYSARFRN